MDWEITTWLLNTALSQGFDLSGTVSVSPNSFSNSEGLWHWLSYGMYGSMDWMHKTGSVRLDPRTRWPDLRGVLVVASSYDCKNRVPEENATDPKVSMYAWEEDYHQQMGRRLSKLAHWAKMRYPDYWFRPYVDTGPVSEKMWAYLAGLGWIGRHANLINLVLGSWIFLGVILTNAWLAPVRPYKGEDRCGTCRRCMDQCPTGAIIAHGVVDARRCISYWTIEYKGPFPEPIRPLLGTHLFGCDICQEVCPWNRRASQARRMNSDPRFHYSVQFLINLLLGSESQFKDAYRNSVIQRLGFWRFRRNLLVALGNSQNTRWIPALQNYLTKEVDPALREHAAWALNRLMDCELKKVGIGGGGRI